MKTSISSLAGAACAAALFIAASALGQNLYVGDYTGGTIFQITPGGVKSPFATGQNHPAALAVNSAGDLFVANTANNVGETGSIIEITPGGVQSTFASGIDPTGLAFDSMGNLFETDYHGGIVNEFAPNGAKSTFTTGFTDPISAAFDSSGNLFVGSGAGANNGIITKITPGGVQSTFATGLSFPQGLEFNSAGLLFETDNSGHVFEFTPGGTRSTFASVTDGNQMAFDSSGNMFVAAAPGKVLEITPAGTVSTFATPGGLTYGVVFWVPEPSMAGIFGMGAGIFLVYRRYRKGSSSTATAL